MINHISIRNFAIIENTEIDFEDGLNIITGETGSGKSIVIEAISLALGSRADSAFVRFGADKAVVQLAGELNGEEIVITREVSSAGKNLCRLNGQIVTLSELLVTCRKLADIHGQYDNQSLLNSDNHINLVDRFHSDEIDPIKEVFLQRYEEYTSVKSRLTALLATEAENLRKKDFYRFEIDEIAAADLKPGEDEELEEKISLLQNSEKIYSAVEGTYELLNNSDNGLISALGTAMSSLQSISGYSKELNSISEDFSDLFYRLDDIAGNLRDIKDKVTFSPYELDDAISRLNTIDGLKRKYGPSIDDILAYMNRISEELFNIDNFDSLKIKLSAETEDAREKLKEQAEILTKARKRSAAELEKSIEKELKDLNFDSAQLSIDFKELPTMGPNGNDLIEIMISTNRGEPLKPLAKIASGGEISRIMLAIKNITGTYDSIPTMIFDEIDAGISGITASIVGRKLKEIAEHHQIICITHLPQIAACGQSHYRIYKEVNNEKTYTRVDKLKDSEAVDEIARLLGGENITDTTRKSAIELLNKAKG
ncbi:MAG: DNA repair protein RecN [Eubacteriaceae bacterium]|nr:DNA repair protein RecN [Eubacteriaceae bacterium]